MAYAAKHSGEMMIAMVAVVGFRDIRIGVETMGKSITPAYRIEMTERRTMLTPMSWRSEYGKPTAENLEKYVRKYIDSLKIGGTNQHVSLSLGYIPVPDSARIVRQKTGEVVATWKAPMFMAF
jgi:hypothetical protein